MDFRCIQMWQNLLFTIRNIRTITITICTCPYAATVQSNANLQFLSLLRGHIWCSLRSLCIIPSIHQPCLKLLVPAWIASHSWTSVELAKAPAASLPGPLIAVGLSRPVAGVRPMLSSCHVAWADRMTEYACFQTFRNWKYWNMLQWPYLDWKSFKSPCTYTHSCLKEKGESEPKRLRMLDCAAIAKWAATSAWFALVMFWGAEEQFNTPTN